MCLALLIVLCRRWKSFRGVESGRVVVSNGNRGYMYDESRM
jgi:hypothetical protein